jgi:hypothetical protein
MSVSVMMMGTYLQSVGLSSYRLRLGVNSSSAVAPLQDVCDQVDIISATGSILQVMMQSLLIITVRRVGKTCWVSQYRFTRHDCAHNASTSPRIRGQQHSARRLLAVVADDPEACVTSTVRCQTHEEMTSFVIWDLCILPYEAVW